MFWRESGARAYLFTCVFALWRIGRRCLDRNRNAKRTEAEESVHVTETPVVLLLFVLPSSLHSAAHIAQCTNIINIRQL